MSRGTGLLRLASEGLSHLFLKTFAAVFPDPTDRPWVCEDGIYPDFLKRYLQIHLFLLTVFSPGQKQSRLKRSDF